MTWQRDVPNRKRQESEIERYPKMKIISFVFSFPVTEDELHAYVDGELPAERSSDVEAWLAAHAEDAERVQSWRTMAEALHARYDSVANEPVPQRLELERLERQPRRFIYGSIAAALIAFVAGGGVGWFARGETDTRAPLQSFTEDAL